MTVSTTIIKNLYPGTGSQANFVYAFKIIIDADLEVIIRTNCCTETECSQNTSDRLYCE